MVTAAKRSRWLPTFALSGTATQRFYRGGSGSTPVMGNNPNGIEWFVGVSLSVPVFDSGQRSAEVERTRAEVRRLQREQDFARDLVMQSAASSLHQMGARYAGIRLSQDAARAAKKSYELMAQSYAQGAVRVIDVLDAQNAWISADQGAADSIFQFYIDWINVQRAVGKFAALINDADRVDLIRRATEYIGSRKNPPTSQ